MIENLTEQSRDTLAARVAVGREAVELGDEECAWDYGGSGDGDSAEAAAEARHMIETNATDVISDMLTAIYGPAGVNRLAEGNDDSDYEPDTEAYDGAHRLLALAFELYLGDGEDYTYVVPSEPDGLS